MELGVIDLRLIGFDRAIELAYGGALRIELLLRNDAFLEKQLKALKVYFGVLALSHILCKLAFGLFKLNLKRARVNLRKEFALLNKLAFLECDVNELTVNAAANRDGVVRLHRAKAVEINGAGNTAAKCSIETEKYDRTASITVRNFSAHCDKKIRGSSRLH